MGSSESKELSRATSGAMLGIILSRLSGIVRQQVVLAVFGAGAVMDAFVIPFRYANMLRDLLAEGALSSAFTKVLVDARSQGIDAERRLISIVFAFFGGITLLLSLFGVIWAPELMTFTTDRSFHEASGIDLAAGLFRVLIFYMPLTMLSAATMAILSTRRKTFNATMASSFFNVGMILGALALSPLFSRIGIDPLYGLAVGVVAGGIMQFLYQAVPVAKLGLLCIPKMAFRDIWTFRPLIEVMYLMGPRAMAQGAVIINLFINTLLATQQVGTSTYISSAQLIILVPIGLFGVATGFSSLPMLTEALAAGDRPRFVGLLRQGLHSAQWLSFLSVLAFAICSLPFCIVLFEHGRFTRFDSIEIAAAICAYAAGIVFTTGSKVLQQGFFAMGDTRRIVVNSTLYMIINGSLSYLFSRIDPGPVSFGIAASTAAACDFGLNLFFLERMSRKRGFSMVAEMNRSDYSTGAMSRIGLATCLAAALGVFWAWSTPRVAAILGHNIGFLSAIAWLSVEGIVLGAVAYGLTHAWGPASMKRLMRRNPIVDQ